MAKKKSKKKLWIFIGGVVVVAILAVFAMRDTGPKATEVNTGKVKTGEIVSIVTATGTIKPKRGVDIKANVSGEIINLPVVEGQWVEAGDKLVDLEPERYQAAYDRARAALASARADLALAKARAAEAGLTYDRQKALFDKGLTSQEIYDAARTNHEVQQASHESARHRVGSQQANLDDAKNQLAYTSVVSSTAGIITELGVEAGEIVIGSNSFNPTKIMTISDMSEIEVEVEVDETDIADVALSQKVEIELDAFPDTTYAGAVTEIGNSARIARVGAQDQVTNFLVTILLTDEVPGIKPGMTATCDITVNERESALKIPIGAVVMRDEPRDEDDGEKAEDSGSIIAEANASTTDDEGSVEDNPSEESDDSDDGGETGEGESSDEDADDTEGEDEDEDDDELEPDRPVVEGVFVIKEDNTVEFRQVKIGISDQQFIEVLDGLEKGERIVSGPFRTLRKLEDGDHIKAKKKWKRGKKA